MAIGLSCHSQRMGYEAMPTTVLNRHPAPILISDESW
jgi:hypothetical protein